MAWRSSDRDHRHEAGDDNRRGEPIAGSRKKKPPPEAAAAIVMKSRSAVEGSENAHHDCADEGKRHDDRGDIRRRGPIQLRYKAHASLLAETDTLTKATNAEKRGSIVRRTSRLGITPWRAAKLLGVLAKKNCRKGRETAL
jgi:hypothetical protein